MLHRFLLALFFAQGSLQITYFGLSKRLFFILLQQWLLIATFPVTILITFLIDLVLTQRLLLGIAFSTLRT